MRRSVRLSAIAAGVVLLKLVLSALDAHGVVRASTPLPSVLLGVIIGLAYGLLAVGLVLVYRSNRIINFAHGNIGAFGAAFFGLLVTSWGLPYWVAFPLAVALAALVATAAEAAVVRRLQKAPRIMSIVATLGVGQFLAAFALVVNATSSVGSSYPQPRFMPTFDVGALHVTAAYSGILVLAPVSVLSLAVFLRRSRFGLAIRAAAANPDAAAMAGIFSSRMSSLAWALAGGLSALTAILTAPTQASVTGDSFGPALLLRALTAAVMGRMESLPIALAGGVGIGVVEQLLLWNYPSSGLVELVMFGLILVTLLTQRQRGSRERETGSWASVQSLRPLPRELREVWAVRHLGTMAGGALLLLGFLLPLGISNHLAVSLTGILGFAMVGLSVGILTGLCGQLTLGQFAVAASGAVISYEVSRRIGDFPLALTYAGLGAGIVCVVVGLPSLRIRGLMLTVTTLSFALAMPYGVLARPGVLGTSVDPGRPVANGHALTSGRGYYLFTLVVFTLVLLLARNIRGSGLGRLFIAVRDNEDNARAFGVHTNRVKVLAYLLSGFIAGVGGATYGHSLSRIGASTFPADASIDVAVMAVVGGMSLLIGPVVGAFFVHGLPLLPLDSLGIAATKLGALLLILWKPAGITALLEPLRDRVVRVLARGHEHGEEPPVEAPFQALVVHERLQRSELWGHAPILTAEGLSKHFGGVTAVADATFDVAAGEVLGLIGPNGAGKTTTFELLSGFTRADAGRVSYLGRDVSRLGPERRAELGLIRSFQDAALFPTMTVTETICLALERMAPTSVPSSVVGWTRGERAKRQRADELVGSLGLQPYRDKQVMELSTGTRRIVELTCLVALEPTVLLLDEPSGGIAQRETEALGEMLLALRQRFDLTLVVIEHDIPLITSIADRIVVMAEGRVIERGAPAEVMRSPVVLESYLGGDVTAIQRSGTTVAR